jgi:hypothetical protein
MRDPAWQFAGVVVALIALLVSVYVAYDVIKRSTEHAQLEGVINRKYYLGYWSTDNQELEVYYLGQRVRSVSGFFFTLQNIGEKAVRPEDYYSGPIIISVDGSGQVAKVEITKRQPETIDLTVSQISTNTFQLSQSLLNPGDQVEFQVTLVNEEEPWLDGVLRHTSGRIVDVGDIRFRQQAEPQVLGFTSGLVGFSFSEAFILAIVAALLFLVILRFIHRKLPDQWNGAHIVIKIVILAAMSVIVVFWIDRFVNAVFGDYGLEYWQFWAFPAIVGGILVVGYAIWIVQMVRRVSKKEMSQQISVDRFGPVEQGTKPNDAKN